MKAAVEAGVSPMAGAGVTPYASALGGPSVVALLAVVAVLYILAKRHASLRAGGSGKVLL
jgi:hypothetical protein